MAVLEGITQVTNYKDVKHEKPVNPSHGDNWLDGTVMKWYDSTNDSWVEKELKGEDGKPTGVTTQPTIPTSPYVGMLWQNTGNIAGYLTGGTYQWNGAKWNLYIFMAQNIAAETLSSISANLGTVYAGTMYGTTILSAFERTDFNGSPIKKVGEVTMANGRITSDYNIVQTTNNQVLAKGSWTIDEEGYTASILATDGTILESATYSPDGISLEDANESFGTVKLSYQHLLSVPETLLTASTSFSAYGSSDNNKPTAQRTAGLVTLKGAFKNNIQITGSSNYVEMCKLPKWACPSANVNIVAQASGMDTFYLSVRTDGSVFMSKFGVGAHKNAPAGTRFDISFVYPALINV